MELGSDLGLSGHVKLMYKRKVSSPGRIAIGLKITIPLLSGHVGGRDVKVDARAEQHCSCSMFNLKLVTSPSSAALELRGGVGKGLVS